MIEERGSRINLTREDADRFYHLVKHPDKRAMVERDKFFAKIDRTLSIEYLQNGDFIIRTKE